MFGAKMRRAQGEAGALEAEVEAETGLTDAQWKEARIEGTRRMGRLLLPDLEMVAQPVHGAGTGDEAPLHALTTTLELSFSLPKGAFATSVLREFMKVEDGPLPAQEVDVES
jgi:tRNA pseudouridine13 synthase